MPNLLLLEDHEISRINLAQNLERERYAVRAFATGTEALHFLRSAAEGIETLPEVAVLDRSLPDMDGLEVLKGIRSHEKLRGMQVLLVTARTEEIDRILGLELGADDYVSKPFSFRELLARIRAIARRSALSLPVAASPAPGNLLRRGALVVDLDRFEAELEGQPIPLTRREFELLAYFLRHPGQVLTRRHLVREVWKMPAMEENRTVDVHVTRLRAKLGDAGAGIQTVVGVGYRFD